MSSPEDKKKTKQLKTKRCFAKRQRTGANNASSSAAAADDDSDTGMEEDPAILAELMNDQPAPQLAPIPDAKTPLEFFSNMKLRKIVKENHGAALVDVSVCADDDKQNLVMTIGSNQMNLYDNAHFGNHLDLFMHYLHPPAEGGAAKDCTACCWIGKVEPALLPADDVYLAMGTNIGEVLIISVAYVRVIRSLQGHNKDILEFAIHPSKKDILASCSLDQTVKIWNYRTNSCLATMTFPASTYATCLCWASDDTLTMGTSTGVFRNWKFKEGFLNAVPKEDAPVKEVPVSEAPVLTSKCETIIDCMKKTPSGNLLARSRNGTFLYFDALTDKIIRSFKMFGNGNNRAKFDVSKCGQYVCCGNGAGQIVVFDLTTGEKVKRLEFKRIKAAIRATAFASGCREILAVTEDTFLLRWDYVTPGSIEDGAEE